jgi:hypothetical protein
MNNNIFKRQQKNDCELCGGTGQTLVKSKKFLPGKKPGSKTFLMDAIPCICKKNEVVESRFPYLSRKTVGRINAETAQKTANSLNPLERNILFQGGSKKFFRAVKSILVHYSFRPEIVIHMSTGSEVISQYYVEQKDESGRKIEDLIYSRDLVILMFNTKHENRALKEVIYEVIEGRYLRGKPTWIWSSTGPENFMEYSSDLNQYFKNFRKVKTGVVDVEEDLSSGKEELSKEDKAKLDNF